MHRLSGGLTAKVASPWTVVLTSLACFKLRSRASQRFVDIRKRVARNRGSWLTPRD
jgi:hypothetical protein